MAIKYEPSKIIKKIAPEKTVEKLVTNRLTLNRATVKILSRSGVISKRKLETTALKIIKGYKEKYRDEIEDGSSQSDARDEAINDKKLMVSRVQSSVVHQISEDIKEKYHGEFYEWLPSDAETPDPVHQLNYGKVFQIGKGEAPGERFGCRCGMNILVDEDELEL